MPTEHRICNTCAGILPIGKFRRRFRGSEDRHRQCHNCRNAWDRNRRLLAKMKIMDGIASQLKHSASDRQVMRICSHAIELFGGIDELCTAFVASMIVAIERRPLSRLTLRYFEAVFRLAQFAEDHHTPVEEMPDEELGQELEAHLTEIFREHPEIAVKVAKKIGWEVRPIPCEDSTAAAG